MSRLQGRHTVITGAASGIGEQTARLFVAEGATVVLADVDRARGEHLADELGDQARFVPVDVAVEGEIERAIEESQSAFGGFDCIFNNAGNPGSIGRIEDIDMALFDRTVAIHLRGVFLGIRAAARVMRPLGRGSIVNTGSVAGLRANYGGHDYSAAKAAIIHLTRTTANELGEDGVRVNAICPGGIATSIFGRGAGLDGDAAQSTVAVMEVVLADVAPIKRAGMPLDIAECALWLASDASSFVNGQAIAVDGGLVTGPTYRTSRARTESMVGLLADIPERGE
ncbi:MAG: glucose 1-dehydrogenase [Acidimicrobiales bacterium]|jgi:NAD(P)-dependent dehydrogenase (short-subunit alcohol dehydrogenase family)